MHGEAQIKSLEIKGIRSFHPHPDYGQTIHFYSPLTQVFLISSKH